MVYVMQFRVDGGCRLSGSPTAVGAAACCLMKGREGYRWRAEALPREPAPTKERADIEAVVMALQWALERYDDELRSSPRLEVRIFSDSRYAVDCMSARIYRWAGNGWVNRAGAEVANRDLIQRASGLDHMVRRLGAVSYIWIPRGQNGLAVSHCNDKLAEQCC